MPSFIRGLSWTKQSTASHETWSDQMVDWNQYVDVIRRMDQLTSNKESLDYTSICRALDALEKEASDLISNDRPGLITIWRSVLGRKLYVATDTATKQSLDECERLLQLHGALSHDNLMSRVGLIVTFYQYCDVLQQKERGARIVEMFNSAADEAVRVNQEMKAL